MRKEINQLMLSEFICELLQILKNGDKYMGFQDSCNQYKSNCILKTTKYGDLIISMDENRKDDDEI